MLCSICMFLYMNTGKTQGILRNSGGMWIFQRNRKASLAGIEEWFTKRINFGTPLHHQNSLHFLNIWGFPMRLLICVYFAFFCSPTIKQMSICVYMCLYSFIYIVLYSYNCISHYIYWHIWYTHKYIYTHIHILQLLWPEC